MMLKGVNVYLIGMMGTGKSTVGKLIAQKLGYRFFDTDVLIEKTVGKSIKEIFADKGEAEFRELETQVLGEVSACTQSVIATGGGIVLAPKNWSYLHYGLVVWLDVPIDTLAQRLQEDQTKAEARPLLQQTKIIEKLGLLLQERKHLYQQADLRIVIESEEEPEQTATKIMEMIPSVLQDPKGGTNRQ